MDFGKTAKEIKGGGKNRFLDQISNIAYFSTDSSRVVVKWNRACEELYGYKESEAVGKRVEELIIPLYQQEQFIEDFQNRVSINGEEIEYLRVDGSSIRVYTNSIFMDIEDSISYHHIGINPSNIQHSYALKDIIKKDSTTTSNKHSKLIFISLDKNGYINDFNPFAEQLLGYKKDEVIGRNFIELFTPHSYKEKILTQIQESFKDREIKLKNDLPLLCKNGVKKIISWNYSFIKEYKSKKRSILLIGTLESISSTAVERLEYLANYDSLTDLPNKNLLNIRMQDAINRASRYNQKMATIYINLNSFKSINYTLGYSAGDELLKIVSSRLQSELRDCDTIARFSGDEFVILFENVESELNAGLIAKRISKLFKEPFIFDNNELFLDISMGVSFFPSDGNDAKTLLKHANMAMVRSKESEEVNFQFFKANMNEEITNRVILEQNLRRALKNGEFFVEYQPQVDAKSSKIIGAEALLRWTDLDLKSIPPLDFIPIAEDSGLILEVGEVVLNSAISQMKKWHDNGYDDLKIAINISGIQLIQSRFTKQVEDILKSSNFNPNFLELELTESILMKNIQKSSEVLTNFKKRGIQISIDDFGTGYSSLSYLSKLPIDALKIDQSFIANIENSKNDKVIIKTIIAMAHSLGFSVIAEGVENIYQKEYLTEVGSDALQGYLFKKPLSAKEFQKLIENSRYIIEPDELSERVDYELVSKLERYTSPLNLP